MTQPKPKLVVFDLDGTLIDSVGDLTKAINILLDELHRAPLEMPAIRKMVGDGAGKLVERALEASPGQPIDHEIALDRFMKIYGADPLSLTAPYTGVPETLTRLQDAGLALAICTNKPEGPSRQILDALDLTRFFPIVIGGDSLAWRKPDPRPLLHVPAALDIPVTATWFVGDSEVDAETAVAAEIPLILMTYGYHRGPVDSFDCLAALDHFAELEPLLLG
jgi:phosphoglycolate phosphatase